MPPSLRMGLDGMQAKSQMQEISRYQKKVADLEAKIEKLEGTIAFLENGKKNLHGEAAGHQQRADAFESTSNSQGVLLQEQQKKIAELEQ